MSRIGRKPVPVPNGVTVNVDGSAITVKGPKGELSRTLHRDELTKISHKIRESGFTIVPLQLYFVDGRAKVEIGVARGKKEYDKRQTLREQQDKREALRVMRERNRR